MHAVARMPAGVQALPVRTRGAVGLNTRNKIVRAPHLAPTRVAACAEGERLSQGGKRNVLWALRGTARKAAAMGAALALLLGASPLPAGADAEAGKAIFNNNCTVCHLGGKNAIVPYKTLFKEDIEQYLEGGLNVDAIQYQVWNGKNQMPAFADVLDEDEVRDVAEYVYQTSVANGWVK